MNEVELERSRAIAGRTARCRCKFRQVSIFTTAWCGFSAITRLSCRPYRLHQRQRQRRSATVQMLKLPKYAYFHGCVTKSRRHTTPLIKPDAISLPRCHCHSRLRGIDTIRYDAVYFTYLLCSLSHLS